MTRKKLAIASCLGLLLGALMGASCGDKKTSEPDYEAVGHALDRQDGTDDPAGTGAAGGEAAAGSGDWNVAGVDVSKLDDGEKKRFGQLLDKLPSPCGKPHSLRTSLDEDESCKRAPFAARYVVALVGEAVPDLDLRKLYEGRYRGEQAHEFDLADTPRKGPADAKVVIVEFFDYGCPHCAAFRSTLDQLVEAYPSDVAVYFKQFPLAGNPHSVPASRAALAAAKQGKYAEMHEILLENQRAQSKKDLFAYAKRIGLDMEKFEADFNDDALGKRVLQDRAEGIDVGVQGTPALYVNGREFTDPLGYAFLKDWIEEALAVNR